ncbi:MAG: carbon-nitrogen hydrolase family protein [Anaerolineaceae bacterium]|nr:carbon-nitrogen hydrolase family protein [Anaerolineaceae bacterium]
MTKIALVQLKIGKDVEINLRETLKAMESAAEKGAQLVCFPEIQFSPFFPQFQKQEVSAYTFSIEHEVVKKLQRKCRETGLVAVPNIYLQVAESRFDASPVIDADGTILGISKMVHVIQMPCFYEQDYYAPSDTGFMVYDTAIGKVGVVICFDRHMPESIRSCALKGAQIIVIPTANTKPEPMEMFEWEIRVSAMQNGVYIAMCNRVGLEGEMDFAGESLVVSPDGDLVAKADDTDCILYADVDFELVDDAHKQRPYLDMRRPDMYDLG